MLHNYEDCVPVCRCASTMGPGSSAGLVQLNMTMTRVVVLKLLRAELRSANVALQFGRLATGHAGLSGGRIGLAKCAHESSARR